MIDSRLNRLISKEIEKLPRAKNNQAILVIAIILLTLIGIYFLKPAITGFIAVEKQFNYSDNVNLEFNESSEYIWIPKNQGILNSLKLSGSYITKGNVKVYLESQEKRYLIFDNRQLDRGVIDSITGLVVQNENKDSLKNNNKSNNNIPINDNNNQSIKNINPKNNETIKNKNQNNINQSNILLNNDSIIDNKNNNNLTINENQNNNLTINNNSINNIINNNSNNNIVSINESINNQDNNSINNNESNIDEITNNKTIKINLEYKSGSVYDVDDDGVESNTGIVDLTVENSLFNWDVDESELLRAKAHSV